MLGIAQEPLQTNIVTLNSEKEPNQQKVKRYLREKIAEKFERKNV